MSVNEKKNKLDKLYKRLQNPGQGHIKKEPTIACLVDESMQRWFFAFADPLWPWIKVKVIKMSMSIQGTHKSTASQVWM